MVLVRIFLGWAGIWLVAKGVPPEAVELVLSDQSVHVALVEVLAQLFGAGLAAIQIIWWRLAKSRGWAT